MNGPLLLAVVLLCQYAVVQQPERAPLTGNIDKPLQVIPVVTTLALSALLATLGTGLLQLFILQPLQLDYLLLFATILWAALSSQLARLITQRFTGASVFDNVATSYLLLPTAVTASALLVQDADGGNLSALIAVSIATAFGFALLYLLLAVLQERLQQNDVPAVFRGAAIHLITAGMIALALTGLAGVW
jgi:electron transport complex protein RnfA